MFLLILKFPYFYTKKDLAIIFTALLDDLNVLSKIDENWSFSLFKEKIKVYPNSH